ncbi:hypothetical protein ACKVWC_011578 [Pyricularia oryzae]
MRLLAGQQPQASRLKTKPMYHALLSHAFRNKPDTSSATFSSLTLCSRKPLRSVQKSSVLSTSTPLTPWAVDVEAGAAAAASFICTSPPSAPPAGRLGTAPPSTMTVNSTTVSSAPAPSSSSASVLLSATGFFLNSSFILSAGRPASSAAAALTSWTDVVETGCGASLMSSGGLRRDRRDTATLRSEPGVAARPCGLLMALGGLGRMYCWEGAGGVSLLYFSFPRGCPKRDSRKAQVGEWEGEKKLGTYGGPGWV